MPLLTVLPGGRVRELGGGLPLRHLRQVALLPTLAESTVQAAGKKSKEGDEQRCRKGLFFSFFLSSPRRLGLGYVGSHLRSVAFWLGLFFALSSFSLSWWGLVPHKERKKPNICLTSSSFSNISHIRSTKDLFSFPLTLHFFCQGFVTLRGSIYRFFD